MTNRRSLLRKVFYLVGIAALLVPLYWLGKPAVSELPGQAGDPGGVLAQLRQKYQLSQASLGEIDPASETMRLSLLGMQGVAVNVLWHEANQYQMKKDWMKLAATLDQLAKVAPNFVNAWLHLGWNISFNCVAEFDDYREKYRWVLYGIDYLRGGIKYNSREPVLQYHIGFTIEQKIGRSDEKKLFRRMFKADDEFHGNRPPADRDSWLVSREWYLKAVELVDTQGAKIRGVIPLLYRCYPALNLMYYADAIESEGTFGELARRAWRTAAAAWEQYGRSDIPSDLTRTIRLGEWEACQERIKSWIAELESIEPGLRARIIEEKRATLNDSQRRALATPVDDRNDRQIALVQEAESAIHVSHAEVAARITGPQRDRASELAKNLAAEEETAFLIRHNRDIVNYDRWRARAQLEQEDEMLSANENIYKGNQALSQARLSAARDSYEAAWRLWRKVIDRHPDLTEDVHLRGILKDNIRRYQYLYKQLAEPFPQDFILNDVLKKLGDEL